MNTAGISTAASQRPWVLVTGGAKRLGRCFGEGFAQAGWDVVVHFNQSRDEALAVCDGLRALGANAHAVPGTLDSPAAVQQLFDAAQAAMGKPAQAVVCNASLFEPDTGRDVQSDVLMGQMQVNLAAPMQLGSLLAKAHAAVRGAPEAPNTLRPAGPSIIHVLDQKVFNLNPDYFSYTLSKLALERAVALQAQALAPHVRVNAVAPGLMFVSGPQSDENFARASRVNLMQTPINPMDVARAAVFLATTASCVGATISVDMGQHLVPLGRDVMFALDHLQAGVLPGSA